MISLQLCDIILMTIYSFAADSHRVVEAFGNEQNGAGLHPSVSSQFLYRTLVTWRMHTAALHGRIDLWIILAAVTTAIGVQ